MSNIKFLLPQIDELAATDVLALQEKRTIFPFNLSAKNIKTTPDMALAEKYPFSIETDTGFTYQVVKDGKKISDIQLSNETGLAITGDAKFEKLLKVFFMDDSKVLYRSLINQLTKLGNNQLFILCLGMRAMSLTKGEASTVNLISAPELRIITGDQWIKLVTEVIKDISWGFFEADVRDQIISNFENKLREVVDVELKMLGVNIPALEKAVKRELQQISSTVYVPPTDPEVTTIEAVATEINNDIPTEPWITEQELKDLNYDSLLSVIKEKSVTVWEHASKNLKAKPQILAYLRKKDWVITEPKTETTETTEQPQA
jgi:hypothetical protein